MQLSPSGGAPGSLVTVSGRLPFLGPAGMVSQEVRIYFGSKLVAKTATGWLGQFSARFRVPRATRLGAYEVTAEGAADHHVAWAIFRVTECLGCAGKIGLTSAQPGVRSPRAA